MWRPAPSVQSAHLSVQPAQAQQRVGERGGHASQLAQFAHQAIRFDHIVTRRAGQRRFVDLHMHMPSTWTLGRAAALRTNVELALMSEVPGLRASIQLLPLNVEAHSGDAQDPP